ncbi:hypothetical protein B0F90DRAFT_1620810 [Multifurca ochricompacta]|uniref:Uncharacterized protein n=1 Tax=Multifurca ochricompacta TaxID=376703 RepID=A0AAD4MD53_9AGAM|nr:hypothetical protein B0F90DRAFT_1620810 [Multifurca ochricompacta]
MADFIQGLDASKLILAEAVLSFLVSPFTAPAYNLPIFLFGIYAQESQEAAPILLQAFSGFLGASALFDIIWLTQNNQNVFIKLLSTLLLLLKAPTFIAFAGTLNSRGVSGISLRGGILGVQLVIWSMPGGFTSGGREGYQTVESETPRPAANHTPTGNPPSAPGGYQSV